MLPYSTLMLILLVFFVALTVMKHDDIEYEAALAAMRPNAAFTDAARDVDLAKDLNELIEKQHLAEKAQVEITARTIKISLSAPVLFESGSAEIKPEIIPVFEELLGHLRESQNTIVVEGHTDDIPIHTAMYRSNWELSAARAFSVIHYFIDRGVSPARLVAHGYGEFRPLAANDTEEGRARNRRIEITILRGGNKA
jgi:chemotaxis protein MotB